MCNLKELLASGEASDAKISFAAEESRSLEDLLVAVDHRAATVREGAVYGLTELALAGNRQALYLIRNAAHLDESPGVREAAQEALDWIENPLWVYKT